MNAILDALRTIDKLGVSLLMLISSWFIFGLIAVFSRHSSRRRQAIHVLRLLTRQDQSEQERHRAGNDP